MTFSKTKYTTQYMQNWGFDDVFKKPTVELLGFDGQQLQRTLSTSTTVKIERDGQGNPIYLGIARPGTATSSAYWQVRKLTFDGQNNVTDMQYANGSSDFNVAWDDRGSLGYS